MWTRADGWWWPAPPLAGSRSAPETWCTLGSQLDGGSWMCRRHPTSPGATRNYGTRKPEYDGGSMGLSPDLLGEGERVVFTTRTHIKALVLPVITLILICAATGFLIAVTPGGSTGKWLRVFLVLVALALILWRVVWLFLNWLHASYTVTNRRLVTRSGVFTRVGRDIPLYRINDVKDERGES